MTVEDLIEELKKLPQDLRVFFDAPYWAMEEVETIVIKQIDIEDYDFKTKKMVYPVKIKAVVFE